MLLLKDGRLCFETMYFEEVEKLHYCECTIVKNLGINPDFLFKITCFHLILPDVCGRSNYGLAEMY